jgi:SAM-dependent methyltransferase
LSTNPPSDYTASTTAYYDAHAAEFCANTLSVDMSPLYGPFLREIQPGGRILDAGCGSGRDTLAFIKMGYQVISIDASAAMVAAASELTGQIALLMTFDEMPFEREFDGIWACASLVHVSRRDLNAVLKRLTNALKPSGFCYMSFKYGDSERVEGGRFFNDLNETLFHGMLRGHPELELVELWETDDLRRLDRREQRWLNAIVRKTIS